MIDYTNPVNRLLVDVKIPRMARVNQLFDCTSIKEIEPKMRNLFMRQEIKKTVKSGMSIAITAGSRGIANIDIIIQQTVEFIKSLGAKPFIIPAMGSHGGAVADGQLDILREYGITEQTMGAPIYAAMDTVKIGELPDGSPLYIDRFAAEADGIVLVNRIKPHTGFHGRYESGLFKMMVIGLGKQYGAELAHAHGPQKMGRTVETYGRAILKSANILFGIGILENALDEVADISALMPDEIDRTEPELLLRARSMMPRIFFENLDVLIIDRIGKNISGAGMDTNITHSYSLESGISREKRAQRIAVLDITPESFGAAVGAGFGDATTRRLFDKMDFNTTYPNVLTAPAAEAAKIPMVLDSQELAIKACIKMAFTGSQELRIVRIRDTLSLSEIMISEALMPEAKNNPMINILEGPQELVFDSNGNLFP